MSAQASQGETSDIVKVERLSKSFGQLKAVDNVSFEIHQGEIFGFLGPDGRGRVPRSTC